MTFRINYTITTPKMTTLLGRGWRLGLLALLVVLSGALVLRQAAPATASNAKAVSAGNRFNCVLTTVGGLKCWGQNTTGALGNGTTTDSSTPGDVTGLTSGVAAVSAGNHFTCALTTGGGAKCWGDNTVGQLGNGTTSGPACAGTCNATPGDVSGLTSGVAAVFAGGESACALTTGGGIKCWGDNGVGELGNGTTSGPACAGTCNPTPGDVSGLTSGVSAVSVGLGNVCALTTGGGVKCWGDNSFGELGNGTNTGPACAGTCNPTPGDVTGLTSGVAAVAASQTQACALTTGGGVKCWGTGAFGGLGNGTGADSFTPADVCASGATAPCTSGNGNLLAGVAAISSGGTHVCALMIAGGAKCWGQNKYGQLGDGTPTLRTTPVDVSGLTSGLAAVDAGAFHSCALTTGGGIKCWGANDSGQLGVPNTGPATCAGPPSSTCSLTPVGVTNLTKTAVNITLLAQYHPPESCYNVFNSIQTLLFNVCDDNFSATGTSSVCIDATHPSGGGSCLDLDPGVGSIRVGLVAGDYHVVQTTAPPFHVASPGKIDCNTSSAPTCVVALTTAPKLDPWFPWDIAGGPGAVPDGEVTSVDILTVVQHFGQTNAYFASPAP